MAADPGKETPRPRSRRNQKQNAEISPSTPPTRLSTADEAKTPVDGGNANEKKATEMPEPNGATKWDRRLAAAIAFGAIVQAVAAVFQWDTMRDQINYMRSDQRPWLGFEPPTIALTEHGKPITGAVTVKNYGRSPGTVTEFHMLARFPVLADADEAILNDLHSHYDLNIGGFDDILKECRRIDPRIATDELTLPPGTAEDIPLEGQSFPASEKALKDIEGRSRGFILICYVAYCTF